MTNKISGMQTGLITYVDYKRKSVKLSYWIMFIGLVLLCLIAIVPIIWTLFSGFKEPAEYFSSTPKFLPESFDFGKVVNIFKILRFDRTLPNSLMMFAGTWFCTVVLGGIAGYTLSQLKPKGGKIVFMVMFWMMLMPNTLSMVPTFMMWTNFPLIHVSFQNTFVPFWVGGLTDVFSIILFKKFFDSIPNSFIEAAQIDGCSNIGIFSKIIVPLSAPIISTITIFTFQGSWNNFLGPFLLLKDGKLATVALKLYTLQKDYTEPEQMLGAFIMILPTMLMFSIFSKKILNNNMSAGIKE